MAFELESGLIFNSIFWLTAPRPSELGMVEGMMDDVSVICQAKGIPFQKYVVPSGDDLIRALAETETQAKLPSSFRYRHRHILRRVLDQQSILFGSGRKRHLYSSHSPEWRPDRYRSRFRLPERIILRTRSSSAAPNRPRAIW
jgi:hypothetical protein